MSGVVLLILRFFMFVALYTFIGWILYVIWRDLKGQQAALFVQQIPQIKLIFGLTNEVRTFSGTELLIGRAASCEIHIPSEMISAQHAVLKYQHNQWWLEDFDSTNGTFLNHEQISMPVVVADGDRIRCGDIDFELALV